MAKLTPVLSDAAADPGPSRLELAERHLADLRERARQLDARGTALSAEHARVSARIPSAALDAIEDERKKPQLAALRKELAALPAKIETVRVERDALDRELAEASAAVDQAELTDAAASALRLGGERQALAPQIDAALEQFVDLAGRFLASGEQLQSDLGTLGLSADAGACDDVLLRDALKRLSPPIALAMGVPPERKFITGDLRVVEHTRGWANAPSMVEAVGEEDIRQILTRAADKLKDAA